jgi:hypothetical protein
LRIAKHSGSIASEERSSYMFGRMNVIFILVAKWLVVSWRSCDQPYRFHSQIIAGINPGQSAEQRNA